jgi:translocation and assembly module TamB
MTERQEPAAETSPPAPAPARRRRPLRWAWRLFLALVLLLVTGAALLLATEAGLRLALYLGARLAPGELTVAAVDGRLTGPLEVRGLRYRDPAEALAIELDRLAFDWRPSELLRARLHVVDVALEGVRVTPPETPAEEAGPPPELPDLRLPVEVLVDRVRVADLQVLREGVPPLEELVLRASAAGQRVEVPELSVRLPDLRLEAHGELGLGPAEPADLRLSWRWSPREREGLAGEGRIQGPIGDLRVEHILTGAAEVQLAATVAGLPAAPRWDARVDVARVAPARLLPDLPPLALSGTLASRGTPADLAVEASLRVDEPALGTHQVELAATLAGTSLALKRLEVTSPGTEAAVSAEGSATLGETPGLRVKARWRALQWPPAGEAQAASPEGTLEAEGTPADFRFRADTRVRAPGAPETTVTLAGRGDAASARIERLVLGLLEGQVTLAGDVGWDPDPRWDLEAALEGINPGASWPDWPGKLGGRLATRGRVAEGTPEGRLDLAGVDGVLRGYPLRLAAAAEVAGRQVRVERLALASGEATVDVHGEVGEQALALEWAVRAPRLEQLLPDAAGSLEGQGKVGGTPQRPEVTARLAGSGVRFQDHGLDRLAADIDLSLAQDGPFRLDLEAGGLRGAGRGLGDLRVQGSGSPAKHRVTLDLTRGELGVAAALALAGGVAGEGAWAGRLERADLDAAAVGAGAWRLTGPAEIAVGPATRVGRLCWASGEARVCADGGLAEDRSWKGELGVTALPLALAQPFLPKTIEVAGAVEARVKASGTAAGGLDAEARLTLPGAALTLPIGEERRRLDLSRTALQARVDARGASASLAARLGDLADAEGRVALPGWSPRVKDLDRQGVEGTLRARVPDLAWVRAFAPVLGPVRGRVDADLALRGTLGKPGLGGQVALTDGGVEVPDAGVAVTDLRFTARTLKGERLTYEGGARSGDGTLALGGETALDPKRGWPTRVEVKGQDFVAVDTPEYWVVLSPDLTLSLDKAGARVEGEVFVPRARIKPRALPKGTVAPSRDVVIKGEESGGAGSALPVTAKVRLRLGDQVVFDGFGLRGRFGGDLLVEQVPGREPVGNGKIGIAEGVYWGLGTELAIDRGWVNFAGSPLDNPGLDIQAIKQGTDVVAGVRVTGIAQDPEVELFSRPARPQSEILSYLLFGKPLTSSGSKESQDQLGQAAAMVGGGMLASEVGRQLGLDQVGIEGSEDGPALAVGKYVSPKLFLQYVTGIGTELNRLRIRYDLTKRIQLQTETGDQQAADIFYTFER